MLDVSRDVSVVLSVLYLWEEQIVEPGGWGVAGSLWGNID
jgi:hypothetical protein